MASWAIDLGTTNTGVARWDPDARRPELLELAGVCRRSESGSPLDAPRLVPSAVHMLPADFWTRLGRVGPLREHLFLGQQALIGRPAHERNAAFPEPAFTPTFKSQLGRDALRTLVRVGEERYTARDVARSFVWTLLNEVHTTTGERIRDLVLTVPVDSYDAYRAELRDAAIWAGVRRLRFLDEPVAAAIGYGLGVDRPRRVLIFDMGGGTLHAAAVALTPRGVEAGGCEVLAKEGRAVGGNVVDQWIAADLCRELGVALVEAPVDETEALWYRLVLAEARRVKEAVHFAESDRFVLTAPEELRGVRARLDGARRDGAARGPGGAVGCEVSRARVVKILEERGLYALIAESVERVMREAGDVDEVLLVGGSTLLPRVYPWFEERFGRDRVRGWQPFEAVALGGAAFAGGGFSQSDLIVHDYAILTHDLKSGSPQHVVVVPRGTRFPTASDLWRRQLTPTCALGEPETVFKLVLHEIGRNTDDARRFGWDASGNLYTLGPGEAGAVVVALNAANPAMGRLDPPHAPSDRRARLDVAFGVDADRWLVATVRDLYSGKVLMDGEPVVRLL